MCFIGKDGLHVPYFENIEVSHTSLIQRSKWFIKTICKGSVVRQLWVSMKTKSQSHYSCENKKYTVAIADMLPQMCLSKQLVGLRASSKRLTCIVLQSAGFMLGAVFDPLNKIRSKIHLSFDLELIDSITCLKQIVPSLFSMLVTHLFFNARWAGLRGPTLAPSSAATAISAATCNATFAPPELCDAEHVDQETYKFHLQFNDCGIDRNCRTVIYKM